MDIHTSSPGSTVKLRFHLVRSTLQVSFLYFPKVGRISIMSKTNTESNSNEYYQAI
jgi:hypothetical protein